MTNRNTKPARRVRSVEDLLTRTTFYPATGCRFWTYSLDTHGYAHVTCERKLWTVTRLLWTWLHGPIPPGQQVLHDCDRHFPPGDRTNRRCIEPTHLRLGTNAENSRDMAQKGRHLMSVPGYVHPKSAAKITAQDARDMRASGLSVAALRARYGLCRQAVQNVLNRKTWTDA